jgi:hypothetical protein
LDLRKPLKTRLKGWFSKFLQSFKRNFKFDRQIRFERWEKKTAKR